MADITGSRSPSIEITPSRRSSRRTHTRLLTCSSQGPLSPVASASLSASPSPFAPPSRSSPPKRENDMTAISITGPGDDPAPVSRENDGQTDPARKATDGDVETRDRDFEPPPVPAGASRRSTSSQSRVPSRRMSKTPLFLPSPSSEGTSSEPLIRQRDRDRDHDPLDIISHIHRLLFLFLTTTTSLAQPAQDQETEGTGAADGVRPRAASRPARASQTICRLSNDPAHASAKTAAKGKARAGDNAGPKELVHVLQVAFENNWPGAGSTGPSGKKTKKAVKETVVVVDDEDDEEEESDKSKIPHAPRPGVSCGIYTQFNES